MDVRVKCDDSKLNSGNYSTLWPSAPILHTFVQYIIAFCSRPEAGKDVIVGRFGRRLVPAR